MTFSSNRRKRQGRPTSKKIANAQKPDRGGRRTQVRILNCAPAGQSTHVAAPAKLYLPAGQMLAGVLAAVDPAGQAYPAAQTSVQFTTAKPCVLPNLPAQKK
jgi:hypothetical protein